MIFILSGEYVSREMRCEVGDITWAQLPVANRELFKHQIDILLRDNPKEHIVLVVPEGIVFTGHQKRWLQSKQVSIIHAPSSLGYGKQLLYATQQLPSVCSEIAFLIGPTLPGSSSTADSEWYTVFSTDLEPDLPVVSYGYEEDVVWAGYAKVSDGRKLLDYIQEETHDLKRALDRYAFQPGCRQVVCATTQTAANLQSYFDMRSVLTSERAFNSLNIQGNILKKYSSNEQKLKAEASWFTSVPSELKHYLPQFLGEVISDERYGYSIEYLPALPLSEAFVHGRHTVVFWETVFKRIAHFLSKARDACLQKEDDLAPYASLKSMLLAKTLQRIEEIETGCGIDCHQEWTLNGIKLCSISEMVMRLSSVVEALPDLPSITHGDFCFSNILFDTRMRMIKIIDPRGMDSSGNPMLIGSQLYDIIKLYHSVFGLYDHIIADRYTLQISEANIAFDIDAGDEIEEIQSLLRDSSLLDKEQAKLLEEALPLLFIAMIPLHSDNKKRMYAFLANAFRLYAKNPHRGK